MVIIQIVIEIAMIMIVRVGFRGFGFRIYVPCIEYLLQDARITYSLSG